MTQNPTNTNVSLIFTHTYCCTAVLFGYVYVFSHILLQADCTLAKSKTD